MFFELPGGFSGTDPRAHPRANTFPSQADFFVESLSSGAYASRNTFSISTITDGYAQAGAAAHFPPLRWPDCTSSRLRAEEYDWPVTSRQRPRRRLRGRSPPWIKCWSLARALLSVSPHPGADGLVQGELPPISPEF